MKTQVLQTNSNITHILISQDTHTGSVCKITHIYACTCKLAHTCSISLHLLLRARYFLLSSALLSSSSCAVLSSSSFPPGPSSTWRKQPPFLSCVWLSVCFWWCVSNGTVETICLIQFCGNTTGTQKKLFYRYLCCVLMVSLCTYFCLRYLSRLLMHTIPVNSSKYFLQPLKYIK